MIAFKRISDFKGTSDKREFQPYGALLIIALLIVSSVSSGPMSPIELSLKCAGLIIVLLPLPALITRRLCDLGHLTMGKICLGLFATTLLLELIYRLDLWSSWLVTVAMLVSFVALGLSMAIFLLCFLKLSKVKDTK